MGVRKSGVSWRLRAVTRNSLCTLTDKSHVRIQVPGAEKKFSPLFVVKDRDLVAISLLCFTWTLMQFRGIVRAWVWSWPRIRWDLPVAVRDVHNLYMYFYTTLVPSFVYCLPCLACHQPSPIYRSTFYPSLFNTLWDQTIYLGYV